MAQRWDTKAETDGTLVGHLGSKNGAPITKRGNRGRRRKWGKLAHANWKGLRNEGRCRSQSVTHTVPATTFLEDILGILIRL